MGTVWRARDELLGREVAVKEVTFPPGLSTEDREVLRERPAGGAGRGPARPPRAAAQVGLALLGALETAHRQGVLHRDVTPSNVMVTDDGRVVLTDFGIATSTGDASSLTHTGMLLGSPAFIAPERLRGGPLGPPSDLWSLGAPLFTAVEGRPPYDGDEPLVTVAAVATGEHAPFALAGPLEPVIDGLLTKDPEQRADPDRRCRLPRVRGGGLGVHRRGAARPQPRLRGRRRRLLAVLPDPGGRLRRRPSRCRRDRRGLPACGRLTLRRDGRAGWAPRRADGRLPGAAGRGGSAGTGPRPASRRRRCGTSGRCRAAA